jgi:hypothetical protein
MDRQPAWRASVSIVQYKLNKQAQAKDKGDRYESLASWEKTIKDTAQVRLLLINPFGSMPI